MNYEDVIMALKNGNVPAEGVKDICMGRDDEIAEFERLLEKVSEDKAITKFINGEYGAGKSFFLKVIQEMAYEKNFAVSFITLGEEVPFNKMDVVYKNIAKTLKCKTGTSLEHIIKRWITRLKMEAFEETSDPMEQNQIIKDSINRDLKEGREYSNSFATAIESYNKLMNEEDYKTANYCLAWLRGDSNIPFTEKKKFGVKGDVDKHNAFYFLEALSVFVKSVGYSGLVVLIDEGEYIMNLHTAKLRDTAYDNLRIIYDNCNLGKFKNTLFVFAGTPELYEDPKKGIPVYEALDDRLRDVLNTDYVDVRKPIFELKGFDRKNLIEIAGKIMIMHSEAYNWNASDRINPIISDLVDMHINNASLIGGKVTPRVFVRSFISVLDTVQQNQSSFKESEDILKLFENKEKELEEDFLDDLDDDW